jgi:hypothetical protein
MGSQSRPECLAQLQKPPMPMLKSSSRCSLCRARRGLSDSRFLISNLDFDGEYASGQNVLPTQVSRWHYMQIPEDILNNSALKAAISVIPDNYNFEVRFQRHTGARLQVSLLASYSSPQADRHDASEAHATPARQQQVSDQETHLGITPQHDCQSSHTHRSDLTQATCLPQQQSTSEHIPSNQNQQANYQDYDCGAPKGIKPGKRRNLAQQSKQQA